MPDGISEGLLFGVRLVFAWVIFKVAREMTSEGEGVAVKSYLKAALASAILATMSWQSYGTHTEDADPLYGGGEVVVDFEPTDEERNEHGLFTFTVLLLITSAGVYAGLQDRD